MKLNRTIAVGIIILLLGTLVLSLPVEGECVAHTKSNETILTIDKENLSIGEGVKVTLEVKGSGCISGGCWVQKYDDVEGKWINVKTLRNSYRGCPCKCPRGPIKNIWDYNITSHGDYRIFTDIGGRINISFFVPNPIRLSLNTSREYASKSSVNLVLVVSNPTKAKIPFCDRVDYILKSENGSVVLNVTKQHNYTEMPPNSKLDYSLEWGGGDIGKYTLLTSACGNSITKEFEIKERKERKESENQNQNILILILISLAALVFIMLKKIKKKNV